MRNLTQKEINVLDLLGDAWDAQLKLEEVHESDRDEFELHIHNAENIIMARPAVEQSNKEYEADPHPPCDVCDKPATNSARDIKEIAPVLAADGTWWRDWESDSDWRYGCDSHPTCSTKTYLTADEIQRAQKKVGERINQPSTP